MKHSQVRAPTPPGSRDLGDLSLSPDQHPESQLGSGQSVSSLPIGHPVAKPPRSVVASACPWQVSPDLCWE